MLFVLLLFRLCFCFCSANPSLTSFYNPSPTPFLSTFLGFSISMYTTFISHFFLFIFMEPDEEVKFFNFINRLKVESFLICHVFLSPSFPVLFLSSDFLLPLHYHCTFFLIFLFSLVFPLAFCFSYFRTRRESYVMEVMTRWEDGIQKWQTRIIW